ncbi:hypothetical protein KU6B_47660 [Mameliella alba]|nr:hypothetical protein KU6B_47660 [Mameliella alba]
MPTSLRRQLDEASEKSGRSVTAEIISRLEKSFENDEEMANALDNIDYLLDRVEKLEAAVQSHDEMLRPGAYDWK